MRIAIIEQRYRKYLMDTFTAHPEFEGEIVCFVEKEPKRKALGSIPIIPFSEFKKQDIDTVLIAEGRNHYLSRLLTWLHDENIENIYVIRLHALDTHADFIEGTGLNMTCVDRIRKEDKPYLVHLETHVCDHCNLNCKACNNFSPFIKEPVCTDTAQFEADVCKLAQRFTIGRFFLLGGEPLLEPERCCEMVRIFRRSFPNTEMRLLTNATLVTAMKPDFWECLRRNRVIVHISLYPPVLGKLEEIECVLQRERVQYLVAQKVEKFSKRWTLYPFEDADYNNQLCGSGGCHYLRDGVITKCPDGILIGSMASALGCERESLVTKEGIELSCEMDGWEMIRRLNGPCDLCKRCTFQRRELISWEPVKGKPDVSDWILENRLEYENRQLRKQLEDAEHSAMNLQSDLQSMREEAGIWHTKYDQLNRNLRGNLREKNGQLKQLHCELEQLKGDYSSIQQSISFRTGRALTWLPRTLRDRLSSTEN